MRSTLVSVYFVAALSIGCGGGGGGGPSQDEFPARFAAEFCAASAECCEQSGGTVTGDCVADTTARVAQQGADAELDGASFDSAGAGRCVSAFEGASCSIGGVALLDLIRTCDAWRGVIPDGGECRTFESCDDSADGARASCVNGACVVVIPAPVGTACADTVPCEPFVAECIGGECVALPEEGEECAGSCTGDLDCDQGSCTQLAGFGDDCSDSNECMSDACIAGRCASVLVDDDYCTLP